MQSAQLHHRCLTRPAAEASLSAQRCRAFTSAPVHRRQAWVRRGTRVLARQVRAPLQISCPMEQRATGLSRLSMLEHVLTSGAGKRLGGGTAAVGLGGGTAAVGRERGALSRAQRLDRRLGRRAQLSVRHGVCAFCPWTAASKSYHALCRWREGCPSIRRRGECKVANFITDDAGRNFV